MSKSMWSGAVLLACALWLTTSLSGAAAEVHMNSGACGATLSKNFVCGPKNAEDLLALPDSPWVLTSSLEGPGITTGGINIIDSRDRTWARLPVTGSEATFDKHTYADCPGVLTSEGFSGHGLGFGESANGKIKLFAVNHGAREAVEVFDVSLSGNRQPTITWVGCVLAPGDTFLNGVSRAPGNGIAATKYFTKSNKNWWKDMLAGTVEGAVYEWYPGKGWALVPGSEMSGANGIVLTRDGRYYIVAEWGGARTSLHKIPRDGIGPEEVIRVNGFRPDNLHFASDGRILFGAQGLGSMDALATCMGTTSEVCGGKFAVMSVDPATMEVKTLFVYDRDPDLFGYGTSGIVVGNEIWSGTVRGNKVGVFPKVN